MTVGSLFSGFGGMDLGLERAGLEIAFQVEIDPFCRRVLAKHWPSVPRYGDIRETTHEQLGDVDCLAGGFPCQDISHAGRRAGIDGERSGLWSEFARLVGEIRPRLVVVENVGALAGRGAGRVLGDLAALGFDAEWETLPAAAFGAPYLRERLFIVAYVPGFGRGARRQRGSHPGCSREREQPLPAVFHADREPAGREQGSDAEEEGRWLPHPSQRFSGPRGPWAVEPDVARVVPRAPHRVERIRGLGNLVIPQIAEYIGRRILAAAGD